MLKKVVIFAICYVVIYCVEPGAFSSSENSSPGYNEQKKTSFNEFRTPNNDVSDKQARSNLKQNDNSEILKKYNNWRRIIDDTSHAKEVFDFFNDNPHWALFNQSVKNAERHINDDPTITDVTVIEWFKKYPPSTKEGTEAYIDALLRNNKQIAEKYIKQTYVFQNLEPEYVLQFKEKYGQYLNTIDDAQRVKYLTSKNNTRQLIAMKNIISDTEILQYIDDTINSDLNFSKNMLYDASERYKYIEKLIKKGEDLDVARIMNITDYGEDGFFAYKQYFEKRRYIAYNMLRAGKPELAYNVALKYPKNIDDDNKARIEWLLGFISYKFFKNFLQAQRHYEEAYKYSRKDIRKSKNAFWLAELYANKHDVVAAMDWYRKASEYFSTFYGYLGDIRLKQLINNYMSVNGVSPELNITINIPPALAEKFYKRELVQVLIATKGIENDSRYRKYLYNTLIDEIEDPYEEVLLTELAKSNGELEILIDKFYDKQHYITNIEYKELDYKKLVPVTDVNSNSCFVSTVHSVIKQESNFKHRAKSSAGAIGLMQLMPKTAEAEAKLIGIPYKKRDLYNAYNNLQLGSNLLDRLIKRYNNNFVYVFYAYNAGEVNLAKYRKSIQNLTNLSILETIELIPIKETRLYIKSVLRNMFYYNERFGCESKTDLLNYILTHNST